MANTMNLVLGIALIVVGALLLIGQFSLGELLPFMGIVLLVAGILMLLGTIPGGKLIGIVLTVLGILLLANFIDFPDAISDAMRAVMGIINLVAGIILVILGIMKLAGK
jgi:uncharacterized membrane protein HdeD (DUF308 family)